MQKETSTGTEPDRIRLRYLLKEGVPGVVAPQSGGCARHVLSQRVDCTADEADNPVFTLDGSHASSLRLLLDSTVTLIVENPDATEEEYHLTGRLQPTDDGRFRLDVIRAYHVLPSGEKRPMHAGQGPSQPA